MPNPANNNDVLSEDLRRLFAKAKMPTNPALATELLRLTKDANAGAGDFADLIRTDPALATRLLKTANSVQFAQRTSVTTIERSVTVLGLNRVKTAVLSFELVSHLDSLGGVPFDIKTFWQHSVLRACLAHSIAQTVVPQRQDEAFLVGLLEECGVLLLVQVLGASYATLCRSSLSPAAFHAVERDSFPHTHVDAISVMASEWNLPPLIALPLARHHDRVQPSGDGSDVDQLSAIAYFVGGLRFASDLAALPEDGALREFGAASLGLDEAGWTLAQQRAAVEYGRVSILFGSVLPQEIDVGDLLSEANRQLATAASDTEQRVVNVEAERVAIQQQQRQLQSALREYRERAAVDPLTNVLNRGALTEAVRQAIKANLDEGVPLGVFFLDIDDFKRLNDTYGHQVGDKVLKTVAAALGKVIKSQGPVGRYGGEEFVVLLSGLSAQATHEIAEDVVKCIRELDTKSLGFSGVVTCSLGAVWTDRISVDSAEQLFAAADQLMYRAKRAGKDQCCFELLTAPTGDTAPRNSGIPSATCAEPRPPSLSAGPRDATTDEMLALARQLNDNDVDSYVGIRKQDRKKLVAPCTLHYFGGRRSDLHARLAATRNLSTGGVGLLVDRPMARGEPVEVVLDRGASKLFLAGLVSYCRYVHGRIHEIGVQFVAHSVAPIISGDPPSALNTHNWVGQALDAKRAGKLEYAEYK